jgi:hypothetical protein
MIFHCKAKSVSRAAGRSAVGAAAYRSAERLVDDRTGEVHDYTKKRGVVYKEIIVPEGAPRIDRRTLWNMAEAAEKRKDAKVAREWELGLPVELGVRERRALVRNFAHALTERYNVVVDIAIHLPGRGGDIRNHHAHLLTTTRSYSTEGLGDKTRVLDSPKTSGKEVGAVREIWEGLCNQALSRAGVQERADRRTLKSRGIDRPATRHLGPAATALERRGVPSFVGDENRQALSRGAEERGLGALHSAETKIAAAKQRLAERRTEKQRRREQEIEMNRLERQKKNEALMRRRTGQEDDVKGWSRERVNNDQRHRGRGFGGIER